MNMTARLSTDEQNPNAGLAVQFYKRPEQNNFESEKQQRPIFEQKDFVKIWSPGNTLNIVDTPVNESHKRRFPMQWQAYSNRMAEGGDLDTREVGTPVSTWPRITRDQAEELRGLKFFTVEAIAHASDAQLQSIGMVAGMSAFSFRDEARKFLSVAQAAATVAEADRLRAEAERKLAEANEASMKANAEASERLAKLEAKLQAMADKADTTEQDNKRGPGRPPTKG